MIDTYYAKPFADFERRARERLRVAAAHGFDIAEVTQLNASDRQKLTDELLERRVGNLRRLVADLDAGEL